MVRILPFRALRPRRDLAPAIASVPYDVVDRHEARAHARDNRHSFLHVTKPEIGLSDDVDPYADRVYEAGAAALDRMTADGWLVRDPRPCLYAYELTLHGRAQLGIVLCACVADYDANRVRKHEQTRPDKERDRMRHIDVTGAQTGTVFLVHRDTPALDEAMARVTAAAPENDFEADDGVRHRTWVIDDDAIIRQIANGFAALAAIYIADGHHRSAAASRVAASRRQAGEPADGPSQSLLAVSFPETQVHILPYNRVVRDLGGLSVEAFVASVRERFEVSDGKPRELQRRTFAMYVGDRWYNLRAAAAKTNDPVANLDISILQERLLAPLLGVTDPRRDARIAFVGGIRGDAELERRASETGGVAFSVPATSLAELFRVADAERVMPPKSTWFEPKLRDGLFIHPIGDTHSLEVAWKQ